MPRQFVRNFGHRFDETSNSEIAIIYEPGKFPLPLAGEPVVGAIQNLFLESRIDRAPVANSNGWSGISGDLLVANNADDGWVPILRVDLKSTNEVRRLNLAALAWELTPGVLGKNSALAFRLTDPTGAGLVPPGGFVSLWGSAVELPEILPDGGATIVNGGGGDSGGDGGGGGSSQTLTAAQIVEMLQSLTGSSRLDASAVEGLPTPAGSFGSIQYQENGQLKGNSQLLFRQVGLPAPGTWVPANQLAFHTNAVGVTWLGGIPAEPIHWADGLFARQGQFSKPGNADLHFIADIGFSQVIDGIRIGSGSQQTSFLNTVSWLNAATIQVSNNGTAWFNATDWQTVGSVTGFTTVAEEIREFSFTPATGRFVRVVSPLNVSQVTISEFRVRTTTNPVFFSLMSLLTASLFVSDQQTSPTALRPGEVRARFLTADNSLWISDTQVLGARQQGWTPAQGAALLGAFNSATATLAQCSQRVVALEQALRTHGLIN